MEGIEYSSSLSLNQSYFQFFNTLRKEGRQLFLQAQYKRQQKDFERRERDKVWIIHAVLNQSIRHFHLLFSSTQTQLSFIEIQLL